MKNLILLIFLSTWVLPACSFLGFHSDPYGLQDSENAEENETAEDSYEEDGGDDPDESSDGDGVLAEEEGDEGDEGFSDESPKKRGFFASLFSSDDDEEESEETDESMTEGDDGTDEDFAEGEEENSEESSEKRGFFASLFSGGDDEDETSDEYGEGDGQSADQAGMDEFDSYNEGNSSSAGDDQVAQQEPSQSASPAPQPSFIPIKKIKNAPYYRGGLLVNAVYLARPGDTLESVSQKIYGQDKTADLYTVNPHFQAKPLKTGDKVYYSSPKRPQDNSQLLTYYEDIGAVASSHTLQQGENIRSTAQQLLGDAASWKEIWATNPDLESKGAAEKTVQLRYWPEGSEQQQAQAVAPESLPDQPSPLEETEPETLTAESGPPPDSDFSDEGPAGSELSSQEKPLTQAIGSISKNKTLSIGLIAFIGLLALLITKIIGKARNQKEEFDYTKTAVKNEKISI